VRAKILSTPLKLKRLATTTHRNKSIPSNYRSIRFAFSNTAQPSHHACLPLEAIGILRPQQRNNQNSGGINNNDSTVNQRDFHPSALAAIRASRGRSSTPSPSGTNIWSRRHHHPKPNHLTRPQPVGCPPTGRIRLDFNSSPSLASLRSSSSSSSAHHHLQHHHHHRLSYRTPASMLIKNELLADPTGVTNHSSNGRSPRTGLTERAPSLGHQSLAPAPASGGPPAHTHDNCHDDATDRRAELLGRENRSGGHADGGPLEASGSPPSSGQWAASSPSSSSVLSSSSSCCSGSSNGRSPTGEHTNSAPRTGPAANDGQVGDDFVTIIHFNDCYNIEPGPESSGAAGFLTAINQFRHLNPIILFSGDILSPSFMSTFTKGEQMIPVLNDIGVHCAVFGNHEFDYGVDNLIEFTRRTTFPWLLSNVIDKETSNQLGDGLVYHIIERRGLKFGLIGLIEEDWLSTLSTLDSSDVIYEDFVTKGRELARWLKSPESSHEVDYVIALTHFRTPNDIKLADSVPEIDLILGGHDHDYEVIRRPNCYVIKSGTDFREFSLIKLKLNAQYLESKRAACEARRRQYCPAASDSLSTTATVTPTSSLSNSSTTTTNNADFISEKALSTSATGNKDGQHQLLAAKPISDIAIERIECLSCPPDESLKLKLDKFVTSIDEKMGKVLGQFNCELDGRFSSIRKYETNLGNFVCDIMLASTHADLAILNSGTLRSDRIHPKGDFTMRDLFNILGYIDPIAVLQATGQHVWQALENGVSQWPKLEGRFPQVSGCSFVFDPSKPPLKRINPNDILIGDEPLDLNKHYKLTTKAYLASGKDGYDVLKECKVLVPGDESPDLTTSILNHFEAINILKSNRRTHHRQSLICLSRSSIRRLMDQTTMTTEEDAAMEAGEADDATTQSDLSAIKQTSDSGNNNDRDRRRWQSNNDDNNDNNNNNSTLEVAASTPTAASRCLGGGAPKLDCSTDDGRSRRLGVARASVSSFLDDHDDERLGEEHKLDCGETTPKPLACAAKDSDAMDALGGGKLQCVAKGPSASSPLVGLAAPTPTLGNMLQAGSDAQDTTGSCGGCGTAMATPPSTIARRDTRQPRTKRMMSLYEMECEQCKLEPKVEGRIKILGVNYWPQ
jgi:5'-nucleotidase